MGWLRLVGSFKLQISFAEYSLFYRALFQKRPMILRSLLIEAIPYAIHHPPTRMRKKPQEMLTWNHRIHKNPHRIVTASAQRNTLQHIATHCNTLQHIATHCTRRILTASSPAAAAAHTAAADLDSAAAVHTHSVAAAAHMHIASAGSGSCSGMCVYVHVCVWMCVWLCVWMCMCVCVCARVQDGFTEHATLRQVLDAGDMPDSCVGRDSFMCVTWFIHINNTTTISSRWTGRGSLLSYVWVSFVM